VARGGHKEAQVAPFLAGCWATCRVELDRQQFGPGTCTGDATNCATMHSWKPLGFPETPHRRSMDAP